LWPDEARVQRLAVPHQPRRELCVRTTELPPDSACDWLIGRLAAEPAPEALVKLHLEGPLTREGYHGLELRRLLETGLNLFAWFDLDTSGLELVGEHGAGVSVGARVSQPEAIAAVAEELMLAAADDPAEVELIREARDRLLAAYGGGG